jgi:hypothetical protein
MGPSHKADASLRLPAPSLLVVPQETGAETRKLSCTYMLSGIASDQGLSADVSDVIAWFVLRCHSRSEDLRRPATPEAARLGRSGGSGQGRIIGRISSERVPLQMPPSATFALPPSCPFDRHRVGGCPLTPATPPCVRRARRFEMVTLACIRQIREPERVEIGRGKRDGLGVGELQGATSATGRVPRQLGSTPSAKRAARRRVVFHCRQRAIRSRTRTQPVSDPRTRGV